MNGQQLQLDLFPQLPQQTEQADLSLSVPTRSCHAPVRAITLWQPWATLIALGHKSYETRSWKTSYTGDLIIHAAARKIKPKEFKALLQDLPSYLASYIRKIEYPLGACVAVVNLERCWEMVSDDENVCKTSQTSIQDKTAVEIASGLWEPGRYAWQLSNVRPIHESVYAKGCQGLWIPDCKLIEEIQQQTAATPITQLIAEQSVVKKMLAALESRRKLGG